MRASVRWVRADLRARRGQGLLTVGVCAGVVTALVLAVMLLEGAINPWQGLFARTHGADMMVYLSYETSSGSVVDTSPLAHLPDVRGMTGPWAFSPAALRLPSGGQAQIQLTAMPDIPPTSPAPLMSAPLVVSGTWLTRSSPSGVVLEASFAAAIGVRTGGTVTVESDGGTPVRLTVIGLADTTDQGFYPSATPGLVWAPLDVLRRVAPLRSGWEQVVDFRLADASAIASGQVFQDVYNTYPSSTGYSVAQRFTTAAQVENSMASDERLLGLLLGLFGVIALIAAPCAIANVAIGRVLMHRRDLAMLKALGFTPGQMVRMLLATQVVLAAAGAGLGAVAAQVITSSSFIHPPDGTPVGLAPFPDVQAALIAAGTVAVVAIATLVPAWRAGRVSPVAAVRASPPRGHLSRLARIGLLAGLPPAIVLGARDTLTRRLPSVLTVFGLAVPLMMITVALSCWATIGTFSSDPARIGLPAGLTVPALSAGSSQSLVSRVGTAYPDADLPPTPLPGQNGTFTALAIGTSSGPGRFPYRVVAGRMYDRLNEAVAGQGFLDITHLSIGDLTWVPVDGVLVTVRITGRILDASDNGDVLAFGLDTLSNAGGPQPASSYDVVLHPGLSPAVARADLLRWSRGQLAASIVANPSDGLGIVRVVIAISIPVLAIIGLASLLTATAIGLRDHEHETGVLAALGLTPRQVMTTLVINTTLLTTVGVCIGMAAGLVVAPRLINAQGRSSGMGSGIAVTPSLLTLALTLALALAVTTLAATAMARHTMRLADPAAQSPARPQKAGIT